MPTRQGYTVLVGAVLALVVGRVFGILELFVVGAGLALAVGLAVLVVRLAPPRLAISRWAHPAVLTVGDTGRVDLLIHNRGRWRSAPVELSEPVGPRSTAHLAIAGLPPDQHLAAGYRVPARRRGLLEVGPAVITRRDLLGLAARSQVATGVTELTVAPQTFELAMPSLGTGVLGRHLLTLAQRIGMGEFHSLRDYSDGDEPRSIHWKASARSETLKVRQTEAEGVRRCIVVLDADPDAWPPDLLDADPEAFERAVTAAGSIVLSAQRAGLMARFVCGPLDLRGPEVGAHALHALAELQIGAPTSELERDPGEGLGLVVVVTSAAGGPAWQAAQRLGDPTLTRVGVFTDPHAPQSGRLTVDAGSIANFRADWHRLAGDPR